MIRSWRGAGAAFAALFFWAALPSLIKIALASVSIPWMLLWRFSIGSLFLLPMLPSVIKKAPGISWKKWVLLTINLCFSYCFQSIAIRGMPASYYIIIFALAPLLTLLFSVGPINRKRWLPLLIIVLGTVAFTSISDFNAQVDRLSIFSLFVGMFSWVWYTVQIKHFQKIYSDTEVTAVTNFISLVVVSLVWAAYGCSVDHLNTKLLILLIMIAAGTPLAYFFFLYSLRTVPVIAITSQYLEPITGIVLAAIFLGEKITNRQYIASLFIVFGLSLFLSRSPNTGSYTPN